MISFLLTQFFIIDQKKNKESLNEVLKTTTIAET